MITKIIPLICRNSLTGEISEFGLSQNDALRALLSDCLESGKGDEREGVFYVKFDELSFSAINKYTYTDHEGKRRVVSYSHQELVAYCEALVSFLRTQTRDFIDYTHDIQYLIGALNALSVQKKSQADDVVFYKSRLEKINLLSIIISAKSTFFRFMTEDIERMERDDVSVEGKTFKIHKGVNFLAESRRKRVTSHFSSDCKTSVKMPDIFEFIPYSIIENAIKYGPSDMEIDIEVRDRVDEIHVEISSMGPIIEADETLRIFDRGYRGAAVRNLSRFEGHGLGLFQAKRASKILFDGDIRVKQDAPFVGIGGLTYGNTTFTISVPKKSKRT